MSEHEPQAGPVTKVARDLREIEDLSALLLTQAVHKANDRDLPGGDAMVALGNVANLEAWQNQVDTTLRVAYEHGDELPEIDDADDFEPPLQTLLFWSEQLRREHGDEYGQRPTISSEIKYLRFMLNWLWDNEPHWDDFAKDIRKARLRLENVLYAGRRVERTRVPCVNEACEKRPNLIVVRARRQFVDRHGMNELSAVDHWKCPACKQRYDVDEYERAYAKRLQSEGAERFVKIGDALAVLKAQGRAERTIRKWLGRCEVESYCNPTTHETFVWWPDLWRLHLSTATRTRSA